MVKIKGPQPRLDILFTAEQLRDAGMALALEHADAKIPKWGDMCYELLKQYLVITSGTFLTEYFRPWAESIKGLPAPPTPKAYGPVMNRAARAGIIKHLGYAPTSNPKGHKHPSSIWIRVQSEMTV